MVLGLLFWTGLSIRLTIKLPSGVAVQARPLQLGIPPTWSASQIVKTRNFARTDIVSALLPPGLGENLAANLPQGIPFSARAGCTVGTVPVVNVTLTLATDLERAGRCYAERQM
jgi:hypothetical protein